MSNVNDGGPAFPGGAVRKTRPAHDPGADFRVTDVTEPKQSGMTLRDYFAAQALQGILVGRALFPDQWAKEAYAMADAMLEARGEEK